MTAFLKTASWRTAACAIGLGMVLASGAFAVGAGPAIDPTGTRTAAPSGVALDRAERRVSDAYETELADKSDAGRRRLLQTLLNDATQTRDDLSARYVMLREARRLAVSLNDAATADYLAHQIESLYTLVGEGSALDPDSFDAIASAGPSRSRARLPVPSESAYAAARKNLKTKYASYYTNPTTLVRSSLMGKLLAEVDSASEAADQYAALREAADVAVGIGDLKTAGRCAAIVASVYQVEETDLRLGLLTAAGTHIGKIIPARDLAKADLNLADDALHADNYEVAGKALTLAQPAVSQAADEMLTLRFKKREKEIRETRDEYLRVASSLKKLPENPDDKELNYKVGRFYCLSAGNWSKGLPMLVKGSDIGMKLLAETELSAPTSAAMQLQLADAWWDRAASEPGVSGQHCKMRAGFWYRRAKATAPATFPERAAARLLSTARSIDLLAMFNMNRDRVSGQWAGGRGGLTCTSAGVSRIQFPFTVPEEYDYVIAFTLHRNSDSVAQIIPTSAGYFAWTMGATRTGLETGNVSAVRPINHLALVPNKPYTSVVEVRRTGVRILVNGALMVEWHPDPSEATGPLAWRLTDPHLPGFGSAFTEVTLHSARLIEIGTEGE